MNTETTITFADGTPVNTCLCGHHGFHHLAVIGTKRAACTQCDCQDYVAQIPLDCKCGHSAKDHITAANQPTPKCVCCKACTGFSVGGTIQ